MWRSNYIIQALRIFKKPLLFQNRSILFRSNRDCQIVQYQTNSQPAVSRRRLNEKNSLPPSGWVLLIFPVGTFCLGTWQVKRKKWKENLIEEIEYRTTAVPVSLPEDLSDLTDYEYRPVRVKGTFDHSREVFLGPRNLIINGEAMTREGGLLSNSDFSSRGFLVITPFKLSDRDVTILVNRGWVPTNSRDPRTRFAGQIEGEVELEGVVRLGESRAPLTPENTNVHMWSYRNVNAMARLLRTSPVFIDAKAESTVPGGPIGGQTRVTLRNEHLSYIITWYGLSIGTGYMWYKLFIRKKI